VQANVDYFHCPRGTNGVTEMKTVIAMAALLTLLLPVSAVAQIAAPAKKAHGGPGPVVGAGLPVIAVGYGVYWLIRRRRRTLK
jgi:hypothetical protein